MIAAVVLEGAAESRNPLNMDTTALFDGLQREKEGLFAPTEEERVKITSLNEESPTFT